MDTNKNNLIPIKIQIFNSIKTIGNDIMYTEKLDDKCTEI